MSPHFWGHQPQTGHTRRCVPLDRKCLLVNRKLRFGWKDSSGGRRGTKTKSVVEGGNLAKNTICTSESQQQKLKFEKTFYSWVICLHEFSSRQLLALTGGSSSSSARRAVFPLEAFLPWTAQSSPWPVASRSKINPTHEPASTTNTQRLSPGRGLSQSIILLLTSFALGSRGDACIDFIYGCTSFGEPVAWERIAMRQPKTKYCKVPETLEIGVFSSQCLSEQWKFRTLPSNNSHFSSPTITGCHKSVGLYLWHQTCDPCECLPWQN